MNASFSKQHLLMRINRIIIRHSNYILNKDMSRLTKSVQATTNTALTPPLTLATPPILESATLFGQHEEIQIRHGAETYRLRQTRQGKLILTK